MTNEYSGPYAMGDPYAKVSMDNEDQNKKELKCPRCSKQLKSSSGFTLHLQKCCPDQLGNPFQDRMPHQPKGVWELDLKDFHDSLKVIDPKAYFITTGEAVKKTEKLCSDLRDAAKAAEKLLTVLISLKGDAKYLETQWENNRLLLKQKNPRPTSRISQRKLKNEQRERKARD